MGADSELLASYVRERSQEAFNQLVARHIDLVYASARRQMGDAESAEDVTQAVFIMLATKAATLRADVILPAWLLTATWYACKNAMRKEHRRRIHERGASLMRRETGEEAALPDPQVGRVLDEALMSLRESDRAAVVMHYLQGRTFGEVAEAMKTTPEAARKRADRALVKLRAQLAGKGIEMAAPAAVGPYLISAASTKASAAVLATVTSTASGGAAIGAHALANATLKTLAAYKAKVAACSVALSLLIVGTGITVVTIARRSAGNLAGATTAPSALAPSPLVISEAIATQRAGTSERLIFPNAIIAPVNGANTTSYTFGVDAQMKRRADDTPPPFIASKTTAPRAGELAGMSGWAIPAVAWRGKRLELSVHLRTQDVTNAAGLNMRIWSAGHRLTDNCGGGPLRIAGTRDWTRLATVLDVPPDAERIEFGVGLWGPGRVWMDAFTMEAVPETVPTTSDSKWYLSTEFISKYRVVSDDSQPRNGHAAARLESLGARPPGIREGDDSASFVRREHQLDNMRGKRVRVLAMIKSQAVSSGAGIVATAIDLDVDSRGTAVAAKRDLPVRGTVGWLQYSATLDVPANAEMLEYGVRLQGGGTLWIDEVVLEVLP